MGPLVQKKNRWCKTGSFFVHFGYNVWQGQEKENLPGREQSMKENVVYFYRYLYREFPKVAVYHIVTVLGWNFERKYSAKE